MLAAVLEGCEDVLLLPHVQSALLPRVLKLKELEVVPQATLPGADHGHQAEVRQLVGRIDGALLPLQDYGHVQLLHHQVHDLSGRGPRRDV